jgi:AcrR family transcriptional regulator
MYDRFESLPKEKKDSIINASIEEFAKNGYKKGSTNNIVMKAGISKGLLFHYFGSKKNLFLYLFDYTVEFLFKIIRSEINNNKPSDILERYKQWTILKLKVFSKYPVMYEFLVKSIISVPEELEDEIQERYEKMYCEGIDMLLKDIDKSKFRDNIDFNKAIEILIACTDGLVKKYLQRYKGKEDKILRNTDMILEDIDQYLEILKRGFYKK